ncbi:3-deoxy-7-phosphoheptulonate synthase [Oceanospirillaceae bacterium]|jgi:3-deoxy-7-phosphoheptulonate synthase|nr:3-deoxy-7-phosphoheptulonate synthase [Oceanospirillaceae bacterium]MDC1510188.1 3-deoxy-7-phosphoheptulonate synthase [Oceanospirillaceae bacterium]|tara:strand:- start:922 stop:2001 length:1080 start_codon:yes stop_codon:yes gene_type:complete
MTDRRIEDLNIANQQVLTSPEDLKNQLPTTSMIADGVMQARQTIKNILDGKDHRLFVVIGPCSIHDTEAALDYGRRLALLADELKDTLYIVMRVYFEKPRTTVGWKGLINDPHLDGTFDIETGLHIGRKLMLDLSAMGLPLATEALDPISPQYQSDLWSWAAIGARTTESQTHREMSSGLSCPVGFKNGTDGGLTVAFNALESMASSHSFLGINPHGQVSITRTTGNQYGHVVLRGGGGKPNYDAANIAMCEQALKKDGLSGNIMVDCSHANSSKDPANQTLVMEDITQQINAGNDSIVGLMIESNINWGNQSIPDNLSDLQYGVSVTDACIDWDTTQTSMRELASKLKLSLPKRSRLS